MKITEPQYFEMPDGERIGVLARDGGSAGEGKPGLFWLGGFKSTMSGTKASAISTWAVDQGRGACRFDYSGNGMSDPDSFEKATISKWLAQAISVFERFTSGPQIIVGSSMGGWLALLLYRVLVKRDGANRVTALVLLAPAVDMTKYLMWDVFSDQVRAQLKSKGVWFKPSAYDDGDYPITLKLVEDGQKHLLLHAKFNVQCPVRILHGASDPDVPWQHGERLFQVLKGDDVTFTLVKNGDHRLSTPAEINRLIDTIRTLPIQDAGT